MTAIDVTGKGIRLRDFPGWPGWIFYVEIDWRTGRARPDGFHEIRPPGNRRKGPSARPDLRRRIVDAAEAQCGHGTGFSVVDLVVASRPDPHGTHHTAERAETIAMLYRTAQAQGLSPLKTISAAYGFTIDTSGKYHTTVERWVREARRLGFLPEYDATRHAPRRWPGRRRHHPLEPRRARPMPEAPKREGRHAGRILTLQCAPIPPVSINASGEKVADVGIIGRWSDGQPFNDHIEPLRAVTLAKVTTQFLPRINAEFEHEYPGALVRSKLRTSISQLGSAHGEN